MAGLGDMELVRNKQLIENLKILQTKNPRCFIDVVAFSIKPSMPM